MSAAFAIGGHSIAELPVAEALADLSRRRKGLGVDTDGIFKCSTHPHF